MENQTITNESLTKIRKGLPNGAQTEIAKKYRIRVQDVNRILHGQKVRPYKCNYLEIIKDALDIYSKHNALQGEIADAIEELNK